MMLSHLVPFLDRKMVTIDLNAKAEMGRDIDRQQAAFWPYFE